jgi:hypothetical protein
LIGEPEGKGPLGMPRGWWEDDIKMDLEDIEWGDMDWIDLAQVRDQWQSLVNTLMNLLVLYWEILEYLSDWRLLKKDPASWS